MRIVLLGIFLAPTALLAQSSTRPPAGSSVIHDGTVTTNNDCAKWVVSGGIRALSTAGAPCGSGSGGSGGVPPPAGQETKFLTNDGSAAVWQFVPYSSLIGIPSIWPGNVAGNSATASALAADGSNCPVGQYPKGVDASGAAQGCVAISIAELPATVVPTTRSVTSGNGLSGGGTLDVDRQLSLNINGGTNQNCTSTDKVTGVNAVGIITCSPDLNTGGGGGTGNVTGPATSTVQSVPRYSSTDGKVIGTSNVLIDDTNKVRAEGGFESTDATTPGEARLPEIGVNGNDSVSIIAPDAMAASYKIRMPAGTPNAMGLECAGPSGGISNCSWTSFYKPGVVIANADIPGPTVSLGGGVKARICNDGDAMYQITTAGNVNCRSTGGGAGGGIADPGANGIMTRTALNITAPASANNVASIMMCPDAGTTDAYACALAPAITSYVTGAKYTFKANTANIGAATVAFNGLAAVTVVKLAGGIATSLANNDIRAGQWVDVVYDGTNMQMLSQTGNAAAGGSGGTYQLCLWSPAAAVTASATRLPAQAAYVSSSDVNKVLWSCPVQKNGTIKEFKISVTGSLTSASVTCRVQVNTPNGLTWVDAAPLPTITIAAGNASGDQFSDTTNQPTVTAGQRLIVECINGAGTALNMGAVSLYIEN